MVPNPVTVPIIMIFNLYAYDASDHINLLEIGHMDQGCASRIRREEIHFRYI